MLAVQRSQPVSIVEAGGREWWWFEDAFYWESGGYSGRDVLALIRDRQRRATQKLDRARMLLDIDEGKNAPPQERRAPIPRELRRAVFERDGGSARSAAAPSTFSMTT